MNQLPDPDAIYQIYGRDLYKLAVTDAENSVLNTLQANPGADNTGSVQVSASDIGSGVSAATTQQASGGATQQGKSTFDNTVAGYILGFDPKDGYAKFYIGNTTTYLNWTGTQLNINGNLTATSGTIGGFTITSTSLYGGIIKTALTVSAGSTGVIMDTAGLRGYDAVLGQTFNLPTDGTAPTFSSGVINETTFEISTNAVLRTSATTGDGSSSSAGVLINNTGIYAMEANQTPSTANVRILATGGGSLTFSATGYVRGGQTDFNTGTGFFLGYSSGDYKFSIGNTTNYLNWDGTYLRLRGSLDVGTSGVLNNASYTVANLPVPATSVGFNDPSANETGGTTDFTSPGNVYASDNVYATFTQVSSSQGPSSAATAADDSVSGGTASWSVPNNSLTSDGNYAVLSLDQTNPIGHYLKLTNFGFSIPTGATITGVKVEILGKRVTVATPTLNIVDKLVKAGTPTGTFAVTNTTGAFTGVASTKQVGAAGELWGATLTAADVNDPGFGFAMYEQINGPGATQTDVLSIDWIKMTVYYTTISDGIVTASLSWDAGATWTAVKSNTYSAADTTATYGTGTTELWGRTWTRADMVDGNFRVKLASSDGTFSQIYKTFGFATGAEILTGVEVSVEGKWDGATTTSIDELKVKIYYGSSTLPVQAGSMAYASNGRKNGEGAGLGTGVPVFYDGVAWRAVDTGATAAA